MKKPAALAPVYIIRGNHDFNQSPMHDQDIDTGLSGYVKERGDQEDQLMFGMCNKQIEIYDKYGECTKKDSGDIMKREISHKKPRKNAKIKTTQVIDIQQHNTMDSLVEKAKLWILNAAELHTCSSNITDSLLKEIMDTLDRMSDHSIWLSFAYKSGGCRDLLPKKTKLPTPELELCDISDLISKLNNVRDKGQYHGCVYMNMCEDGKLYVGYKDFHGECDVLNAAKTRLDSHRDSGGGTYWTYFYPVISCLRFLELLKMKT
jgi:hypothetical protein